LTRPLGATVGDFLDKPVSHGGLNLSRPLASAVIAAIIVALIILLPQRPGRHPGRPNDGVALPDGDVPVRDGSASRDDEPRGRSAPPDG
jgi:Repeat of Unknown Function (DUF347)